MSNITRNNGFLCISFNQEETKNAKDIFLKSYTINEAIPIELLKKDPPAKLVTNTDTNSSTPIEVEDIHQYPYNACGQITGKIGTATYIGSASVFKRPDIILTAAHCVYNAGQKCFISSPTFYWKRKENIASAIVPITHIFIPEEFEKNDDLQYDYAICVLERFIGDRRNTLQYNPECSKDSAFMIGYPGAEPYDGTKMYYIEDSVDVKEIDKKNFWHVTNGLAYGGASGGPWVVNDTVFGVTSFGYEGVKEVFSPILDQKLPSLYEEAVKVAPLNSISAFHLENDWGWFVNEIHTQYEGQTYEDDNNILINSSGTSSLKDHIPDYAVINIKVYVMAGEDNYGSEKFIFDPNSNVRACYKISGTTFDNELTFEGLETY